MISNIAIGDRGYNAAAEYAGHSSRIGDILRTIESNLDLIHHAYEQT